MGGLDKLWRWIWRVDVPGKILFGDDVKINKIKKRGSGGNCYDACLEHEDFGFACSAQASSTRYFAGGKGVRIINLPWLLNLGDPIITRKYCHFNF